MKINYDSVDVDDYGVIKSTTVSPQKLARYMALHITTEAVLAIGARGPYNAFDGC